MDFIEGTYSAGKFEMDLTQFLSVEAPIAKSITCLESSHSTVSMVYLFFLAVTATIHQIIKEGGLPSDVADQIRKAVNFRFNQQINDAPDDVYLTGFMLDPSM